MPGFIDSRTGFLPKMVNAGSIAELRGKVRHHRLDNFRVDRRSGGMIQIDSVEHTWILS
jgi:hypothetical protein